jgi:hypothetical protein
MANAISSATPADPTIAAAAQKLPVAKSAKATDDSTQAKPVAAPKDTVQISGAAQSAVQEARETRTQTTQEAAKGDRQAQKLLAKETAAQKS